MSIDLLDVLRIQAAYTYHHDFGHPAEFAGLFESTGTLCLPTGDEIFGTEALDAFVRASGEAGVHTSGAPLVLAEGGVRTPFVFVASSTGRVASGYYNDILVTSAAGDVLFRRRSVQILSRSPHQPD